MNVLEALESDPDLAASLGYNQHWHRVELLRPLGGLTNVPMPLDEPWKLAWVTDLVQRKYKVPRMGMRSVASAIELLAYKHSFDPVMDFIGREPWDGKARVDTWLSRYLGVPEGEHARAVGKAWLLQAVRRVMRPACPAGPILTLRGREGSGRSSAMRLLAGGFFTEVDPGARDAYLYTQATWIVEVAGVDRARRHKAARFLARRYDTLGTLIRPRRCTFFTTSAALEEAIASTSVGGLQIHTVATGDVDLAGIERDRAQLWAEAIQTYRDEVQG